jgi:hypothetical protein
MVSLDSATTSSVSVWVPIGGITGIVCMLFTCLMWAEVKPPWGKQQGGKLMNRQVEARSVWVSSLLTISLVLFGGSAFLSLHSQHPRISWAAVGSFILIDVILWVVLLRITTIQDAAKDFANQENYKTYIKAGVQALELFTPLQIEAFQLAKNLRSFLNEIGPHPVITKANGELDHRAAVKYTEWSARLIKGYDGRFVPKIKSISAKVGEVPLTSCYELDFWAQGIKSEIEVRLCAQTLERIALELGSIGELRYSRCEVEVMSPIELSQTAEAYPGFTELVNYYSKI